MAAAAPVGQFGFRHRNPGTPEPILRGGYVGFRVAGVRLTYLSPLL